MKKVWRLYQYPQLLLAKVFRSPNSQGSWIRSSKHKLSWGCKGLLMVSQTLQASCAWKDGNINSIKVATHPWVNEKIPNFRDCISLREATNLTVVNFVLPGNHGWDIRKIHSLFIPSNARQIKGIELPSNPAIIY